MAIGNAVYRENQIQLREGDRAMETLIHWIMSEQGMTTQGHVVLVLMVYMLYRRVNRLEGQLERIARHTGAIAALMHYDDPPDDPPALDGREP